VRAGPKAAVDVCPMPFRSERRALVAASVFHAQAGTLISGIFARVSVQGRRAASHARALRGAGSRWHRLLDLWPVCGAGRLLSAPRARRWPVVGSTLGRPRRPGFRSIAIVVVQVAGHDPPAVWGYGYS
jgi:hypothetical protein